MVVIAPMERIDTGSGEARSVSTINRAESGNGFPSPPPREAAAETPSFRPRRPAKRTDGPDTPRSAAANRTRSARDRPRRRGSEGATRCIRLGGTIPTPLAVIATTSVSGALSRYRIADQSSIPMSVSMIQRLAAPAGAAASEPAVINSAPANLPSVLISSPPAQME